MSVRRAPAVGDVFTLLSGSRFVVVAVVDGEPVLRRMVGVAA